VIAPDLPGHASGEMERRVTLEDYVAAVCGHLARSAEPAVLVGHSMAGVAIAAAAERVPELIRRLVFVAAYLPADGQSFADLARADKDSLAQAIRDGDFVALNDDTLVEALYGDSPADDVAFARARLKPQAIAPLKTPVRLTAERFGRVPRTYIGCRRDRAITHALQVRMRTASPCARVVDLDCDHSPFFSAPRELADALLAD
jgi:pimeloyl-ACP methyl ester carboxylesterase